MQNSLQGRGNDPLVVHLDPDDAHIKQLGGRLHPRVGQSFGQQHVTGSEYSAQRDQDGVLSAVADRHLAGFDGDAATGEPARCGLTVGRPADVGLVGQEGGQVGVGGRRSECGPQQLLVRAARGAVDRQVQAGPVAGPGVMSVAAQGGDARDEGAPSEGAADQSALFGLLVGAADRGDSHAELLRQGSVCRQPVPDAEATGRDPVGDALGDAPIHRVTGATVVADLEECRAGRHNTLLTGRS